MADVAALVASYSRLGLFKHISTVCSEVIAKKGNDPVLALWSAFSSAMEGEPRCPPGVWGAFPRAGGAMNRITADVGNTRQKAAIDARLGQLVKTHSFIR
jgi:hypothetical protein